jgi:hypothetical protein
MCFEAVDSFSPISQQIASLAPFPTRFLSLCHVHILSVFLCVCVCVCVCLFVFVFVCILSSKATDY